MKATKNTLAFYSESDSNITLATGSGLAFVAAFIISLATVLSVI